MKSLTLFSLVVLTLVGAPLAGAQTGASPTPRPTPPAPPYLNATPDFAAWTIARYIVPGVASQSADGVLQSALKAPKPESVASVVKTGPLRHQTGKSKDGVQEDIWYERGSRVTMESVSKIPLFEGDVSTPKQPQGPDFPDFSWVAAGNFAGTQEYQGAVYLVFETQLTEGSERQAKEYGYKLSKTFNRAYINAVTRLPLLLQRGDNIQRYIFQSPPAAMLEVPREYQALFDAYDRKKSEMAKKSATP